MAAVVIACLTFICLLAAGLGSLFAHVRLSPRNLQDETNTTIRLVANLFVVMASLLLGLMANSAKTTFEASNANIHAFATEIILLDRTVRGLGPAGDETRAHLRAYLRQAVHDRPVAVENHAAGETLQKAGDSLRAIRTTNLQQTALWNDARLMFRQVERDRWVLIGRGEGRVPHPVIGMLIVWLMMIFASFGYRAPRTPVVLASFIGSAALLSASLYVIVDMNEPYWGAIQTDPAPLHRALAEVSRE
ncbi:hypothetical protein [Brevundimonas lenta]|uniref:DUF4239 domain-containing protein n=1 Tax=Brevundimonas lenta TaxID=424796 RepID=A0A7W6NQ16_9CAUL|nr:hypothetical protein [Brevundimonas lenta]MBB4083119.1 hypothetical protein [Brevundimonas lenta]